MFKKTNQYLVFGPSQNGKSSFINYFRAEDEEIAVQGTGNGSSCTKKVTLYKRKYALNSNSTSFLDTQGIFDAKTGLIDSMEPFKKLIEYFCANKDRSDSLSLLLFGSHNWRIDGIIYIHSASESTQHLDCFLDIFSKLFDVEKSILIKNLLVVVTKFDVLSEDGMDDFFESGIGKTFKSQNLKMVIWNNRKKNPTQEKSLKHHVSQLEGFRFNLERIEDLMLSEKHKIREKHKVVYGVAEDKRIYEFRDLTQDSETIIATKYFLHDTLSVDGDVGYLVAGLGGLTFGLSLLKVIRKSNTKYKTLDFSIPKYAFNFMFLSFSKKEDEKNGSIFTANLNFKYLKNEIALTSDIDYDVNYPKEAWVQWETKTEYQYSFYKNKYDEPCLLETRLPYEPTPMECINNIFEKILNK